MRDITISRAMQNMNEASARRAGLLLEHYEVVVTWQQAFESVMSMSTPWNRIKWAVFPAQFIRILQSVQMALIQKHRAELEEAANRPKIERVSL